MADYEEKPPRGTADVEEEELEPIEFSVSVGGRVMQQEELYPEPDPDYTAPPLPTPRRGDPTRWIAAAVSALLVLDIGFPLIGAIRWQKPQPPPLLDQASKLAEVEGVVFSAAALPAAHATAESAAAATTAPSAMPTAAPTLAPTAAPTLAPTAAPTAAPSAAAAAVSALPAASAKPAKPSAGWYVQIRAEPTEKAAVDMCAKLRGHGAATAIEPTAVKGKPYFRVLAGPHKTRADAQAQAGRLKTLPFVGQDAFVKQLP